MMTEINKKYNIKLEVLTPLSIGAGAEKDWVKGADFVTKGGFLYKLNLRKLIQNGINPTDYIMNKDDAGLLKVIGSKLDTVTDFRMTLPVGSNNDVKAFIKNELSYHPIVPGSSLKGAIRSHILTSLDSSGGDKILGNTPKGENFMRFVKVSDFEFDRTSLVNTKIFNLQGGTGNWKGGWKHAPNNTDSNFSPTGFNVIYESLLPNQFAFGTLMLSETLYDKLNKTVKQEKDNEKRTLLSLSDLFRVINKQTRDYLEKELDFFRAYKAKRSDEIEDSIKDIIDIIPTGGSSCILKMSAGSGFHSITGDWQFDDNYVDGLLDRKRNKEGKVKPKSRKIAIYNDALYLMGFVRLSVASEAEIKEYEEAKQMEKNAEAERLEKIRVQSELTNKYEELVKLASTETDCRKALQYAQEAESLCPSEDKHKSIIEICLNKIKKEKYDSMIAQADALFSNKEWGKAKELYSKVITYGFDSERIKQQIEFCEYNSVEVTFDIYMSRCSTQLQNIDAFANYLSRWHGEYDAETITSKLSEIISTKDKNGRKTWTNEKKWDKMKKVLGDEKCSLILKSLIS